MAEHLCKPNIMFQNYVILRGPCQNDPKAGHNIGKLAFFNVVLMFFMPPFERKRKRDLKKWILRLLLDETFVHMKWWNKPLSTQTVLKSNLPNVGKFTNIPNVGNVGNDSTNVELLQVYPNIGNVGREVGREVVFFMALLRCT